MRWFVGILVVAALAAGAAWHFKLIPQPGPVASVSAAAGGSSPVTVAAAPVKLTSVQRQIEAVGSLRSNESVIRLDAAIPRAQVEQAKASLVLSRANHERAEDLSRRGAGTERARDEAVFRLRADEAALALAQATLDKATLVAPFDGILGLRKVSVGDYVNPGQDLVNVENIDSLKVDFRVPEIYSTQLKAGQTVRITLDAIAESSYQGTVYAIDPAYDPNGRAIILRARLSNSDGLLRSGMFARVTLVVDQRDQVIVVPETALVPVGQDQFVYRVVDSKAVLTKVRVGQRRRGHVEIVDGLEREAVIVTEGSVKLRDGSAVKTVAAKGA
jgi:membrane fusion protein (multidrug efflux system)